jgi:hypothetical protein
LRRFAFEGDIYETLDCVPMAVRRKLDVVRVKISLQGWQSLPMDERRHLCELPVDNAIALASYRAALREAAARKGASLRDLPGDAESERARWMTPDIPADVAAFAAQHAIALSSDRWHELNEDERYVLVKMADPSRDAAKVRAAYEEVVLGRTSQVAAPSSASGNCSRPGEIQPLHQERSRS